MSIRIDGTNTAANPGITGADADTGLLFGTDEVNVVTGGNTRATVDADGRLLVGTTTAINTANGTLLQAGHTNGARMILGNSSSAIGTSINLGMVSFRGFDSSTWNECARIAAVSQAAHTSTSVPTDLRFYTTTSGATSVTERMKLDRNGNLFCGGVHTATTAVSANVVVESSGQLSRATSSVKYKTNIETLEDSYADALLDCRPVWYRSTCEGDNPEHGWWGFIAEEVAEIDPRLVHWKTTEVTYDEEGSAVESPCDPEPEGVAYDRFVPHLLNLIKRQKEAIEALETRVAQLEGGAS